MSALIHWSLIVVFTVMGIVTVPPGVTSPLPAVKTREACAAGTAIEKPNTSRMRVSIAFFIIESSWSIPHQLGQLQQPACIWRCSLRSFLAVLDVTYIDWIDLQELFPDRGKESSGTSWKILIEHGRCGRPKFIRTSRKPLLRNCAWRWKPRPPSAGFLPIMLSRSCLLKTEVSRVVRSLYGRFSASLLPVRAKNRRAACARQHHGQPGTRQESGFDCHRRRQHLQGRSE